MVFIWVVEVELLCTRGCHDGVEDGELTGSQRTNHDATCAQTCQAKLLESHFSGQVHQAGHDASRSTGSLGLVDQGQQGIGGVGDDGGGYTGNGTGGKGHGHLGGSTGFLQVDAGGGAQDILGFPLHGELSHGVRYLFEQDWSETGVEAFQSAIMLQNFWERRQQTAGELWVGDQANTGGFQGAQENVSNKLGAGGGKEVDPGFVVPGGLVSIHLGLVDFEELNASELEPTLDKVPNGGGAQTGGQPTDTFFGNYLFETAHHPFVVFDRIQLDTGLDNINWAKGTVGYTTAYTTGNGTFDVVRRAVLAEVVGAGWRSRKDLLLVFSAGKEHFDNAVFVLNTNFLVELLLN